MNGLMTVLFSLINTFTWLLRDAFLSDTGEFSVVLSPILHCPELVLGSVDDQRFGGIILYMVYKIERHFSLTQKLSMWAPPFCLPHTSTL